MATDSQAGKLAVILHADIAGSTRLVQQDEHLAHNRIQNSFHRFRQQIEKYQGRVLELRGDALIAEFERASDAVSAALSFQLNQGAYLEELEDSLKPFVRVGIALGEVVIADKTITGEGVVLAQRVEQLSDEGGLCITSAIHEALPKRMPFELESLGDQQLKGFDESVRVFRVYLVQDQSIPPPQPVPPSGKSLSPRKQVGILATVTLLAIALTIYTMNIDEKLEEAASMERMAFPLPDVPSIAVLPFDNLSDSVEQEYFVDGMTEDLITDLSKISGLFVIARNSSFSYKGKQVKVRQVAEDLGVRYVLEGSVRRVGEQVRINAQLIDATTGGHLWAERYDGILADVFTLQDRVTSRIVDAMSVTLTSQERQVLKSVGTSDVDAHDAYLQGLSFYLRNTPADNAKSESYFLRAIELDPEYKLAYAALAKVYFKGLETEYSRALGIYIRKTALFAYRNLAKSEGAKISDVHVVRARMALIKHQVDLALNEAEQALKISKNDVDAMKVKARALIYSGEYEAGQELAYKIMRQDPVVIAEPLYLIGLSHFALGDYEQAAEFFQRALDNDPATSMYTRLLAAAYGKLGLLEKANQAWQRFRKKWHWPVWIAAEVIYHPFQDDTVLEQLAAGFKAAGVAERPPSRYIRLDRENRLNGLEIKSLLFGQTIYGTDFFDSSSWTQTRDHSGKLLHTGPWFYTGNIIQGDGKSWIEDDRLCDQWFDNEGEVTICVVVYRDSARGEGNFLLVNDQGPHPFRVIAPE